MLQSIQFHGSGPPTYVYSEKAVGASNEYYHVFAAETRGHSGHQEEKERKERLTKKETDEEYEEPEGYKVGNKERENNLREVYEKEYGRRESFLWKLK